MKPNLSMIGALAVLAFAAVLAAPNASADGAAGALPDASVAPQPDLKDLAGVASDAAGALSENSAMNTQHALACNGCATVYAASLGVCSYTDTPDYFVESCTIAFTRNGVCIGYYYYYEKNTGYYYESCAINV